MNQHALAPRLPNITAPINSYAPIPDELMKTLIGVYARLWEAERVHSETLQKENLMPQARSLLVCIENYCLNGVAQHKIALTDLVNRMKRLQDCVFFASAGKSSEAIISIANTLAETVRFAEASISHSITAHPITAGDA